MIHLRILFFCLVFQFTASAQIDKKATKETKKLYSYLGKIAKNHILFGHQHATEYGHGWQGEEDRSDVKSITGSHPAVIGVDFMGLSGLPKQIIEQNKINLRKNISDTYNRGGITTVAWHFDNPVSNNGFNWIDSTSVAAMPLIKPGGSAHEEYKMILNEIGTFVKSVKGADGQLVPMLFRPYHEFDGDWFWWGKSHCSKEDFIEVWQFTVTYLKDVLDVHNLLYVFSPDNKFTSEAEFTERYPGNDWVDMVGMDNYNDLGRYGKYDIDAAIKKIQIVDAFAKKNNKLAALTETGLESIPNPKWWTEVLLKTLTASKMNLCYVLVWRNDITSPTHYYAPFPGHSSVPDFIEFYNNPYTFFQKDLKSVYKK